MVGKPPRNPATGLSKKPDLDADGSRRPLDSETVLSPLPHLTEPRLAEIRPKPAIVDSVNPEQAISVSLMNPVADELIHATAGEALAGFRVLAPTSLMKVGSRGVWIFKGREYVAIADGQFVQVVTDPGSGLFRATNSRELEPSGPWLIPGEEGQLWRPLDSQSVIFLDSISAQTAQLFRQMGRSVAQFSDATVGRMLAVSGVTESLLRDVLVNERPAPFLLEDTIRRFELDHLIQAEGHQIPSERFGRFKNLEEAFEADCDENTLRMRRVFPGLPKTAAQAIWRTTSASERLHMHNQPGMPQRVAQEILVALREIRLARAGEGLYLEAVSNPDSDRLMLHMLGNLANWPQQMRIEIRRGATDSDVLGAIGDARSPFRHVLIRQNDGYATHRGDGSSPQGSKDLCSVLFLLLLPEQRQLLGVTKDGGAALRQLIRAQPLPTRAAVSKLLGLAPLPQVDLGTVQFGQRGQLHGGGDSQPASTKSVVERVHDLYPQLSHEEAAKFINERLKNDPAGVLIRLEKEFATLCDELAIWNADGPPPHTLVSEPDGATTQAERRQARERFSAKLRDIWQRKSVSKWGEGDYHFSYYVDFSGELPRLSTRFEYVTELILTVEKPGARMGAFLDSFPNVQSIGIFGIEIGEFPSGIFQMRQLSELTLDGCSLTLSEVTVEGLSRIETLTRLNLANNPLTVAPQVGYMAGLTGLMLSNANLSNVPSGIDALRKLGVVALHDNNISDVGYELFEIPDTQDLFVGLVNNPLSEASRQRISQYLENSSMDRKVEIQVEDVVSQSDSDSESSESGISTGSDSD
ncbi:leucine-rich repeat domain-containing protein [Pseudomonas sp. SWRI99]|uniref:leucine-rich repeat domain-containing protein n=1 Tax=Pseudomonas sp. SWRI99 TaxID=2745506 RepID=UPI0016495B4C|nr:leucine-rich repeat domain-containing protein [Pseudomonas sp. SWRI99]MBC3778587.1 leucine-rich repeat domain-containing protein [Pseudomonas sp. SWRI99]